MYFPDRMTLEKHMLVCIRPEEGVSFANMWKMGPVGGNPLKLTLRFTNEAEDNDDKLLPPSQPLEPLSQGESVPEQAIQNNGEEIALASSQPSGQNSAEKEEGSGHRCHLCSKTFGSDRGLQQHIRSCQKKRNRNQMQTHTSESSQTLAPTERPGIPPQIVAEPSQNPTQPPQNEIWEGHTYPDLQQVVSAIYEEIVFWRKNLFKLPSGAAGKSYIKETTKLIEFWNENKQPMKEIALKMVMIMPAVLLQKPSRKSTAKQHTEYLKKRLDLWTAGKFDELMKEGRAIQQKLKQQLRKDETEEHIAKTFAKLMSLGKVHAALRLLDKAASLGVAELSEETMKALSDLHPTAKDAAEPTLLEGEPPYFDPVLFTNINEQSIAKAALKTRGAAGPSGLDAEGWKRILVSKNYGATGKDLRTALAKMTQHLCTRPLQETETTSIDAYIANRLIPLLKAPSGIRPIGIGEVLRRIIGKAVISEIRPDILESAGNLQLCAGQKAGCEAAAHAMGDIFNEENTDAVLFIDASNAFNALNRKAMLHNVEYLCPPMATYLRNCYQKPSRLFIAGGKELVSAEGTTQGDPTAMPAYGIGILPFLALIRPPQEVGEVKQVAYADDIGGGAKLGLLREWWNNIVQHGPSFGYFPKAAKSWLVVKPEKYDEALQVFANTGINVTNNNNNNSK